MALLKCQECAGQVSSSAKLCPHCGTKKFRPTSAGTKLVAGFILFLLVAAICGKPNDTNVRKSISSVDSNAQTAAGPTRQNDIISVQGSRENNHNVLVERNLKRKKDLEEKEKKRHQKKIDEERFEECRSALKLAADADVLRDIDWKEGKVPMVVVGPSFYRLDFEAKKNVIATVNCFFMSGRKLYMEFDVLDYRTGNPIGSFHWGRFRMN